MNVDEKVVIEARQLIDKYGVETLLDAAFFDIEYSRQHGFNRVIEAVARLCYRKCMETSPTTYLKTLWSKRWDAVGKVGEVI